MEHDEKEYQVIIDPAANDRMYEHFEFLARVSVGAATKLLDQLLADIRSLKSTPFINAPYNRSYLPIGKYRYKISSKRYHIIYQVVDNFVFIDDIHDSRQDDDKSVLCPEAVHEIKNFVRMKLHGIKNFTTLSSLKLLLGRQKSHPIAYKQRLSYHI